LTRGRRLPVVAGLDPAIARDSAGRVCVWSQPPACLAMGGL